MAGSSSRSSQQQMEVIQQLLRQPRPLLNTEAMPRVLDLLWSRLGGLNGKFFEAGWGNLGIVNLQQDLEVIKQWPPKDMQVSQAVVIFVSLLCCSGMLLSFVHGKPQSRRAACVRACSCTHCPLNMPGSTASVAKPEINCTCQLQLVFCS